MPLKGTLQRPAFVPAQARARACARAAWVGCVCVLALYPVIGHAACDDQKTLQGKPATSGPAAHTGDNSDGKGDLWRRLSLMRPLEGGFDLPIACTRVHGYLMMDAATYSRDAPESSHFSVRRADINFQRMVWRDWLFYADGELVSGNLEFKDVYVRKQIKRLGTLTIGNQKEPFGLEQYGSFRNSTFLERATISALAPSRSIGIASNDFHGPWVWSYGFFTAGSKDEGRTQRGVAITGRMAHVTKLSDSIYHLAASFSTRHAGSNHEQRFKSSPEVQLSSGDIFLDTGNIAHANGVTRYGLEAAHVYGPLSWQAEMTQAHVTRSDGLSSLTFRGWYAYASWFLTDDTRPYNDGNATFGAVSPRSPWNGRGGGALEVAVRLSRTNLDDEDVRGGKETNLTLGLNWYLDRQVRLSLNLVHALDLDKPGAQSSGKHPSALVGRFQYQF